MKNFKFRVVSNIMALSFLVFWTSCSKYEDTPTSSVSEKISLSEMKIGGKSLAGLALIDGALHFKDNESFRINREIINQASSEDFALFCKDYSFNSVYMLERFVIDKIRDLELTEDLIGYHNLLKKYSNLFYKEGESLEFKIKIRMMTRVLNEDQILYVDKCLMYFDDTNQILILDGSIEALYNAFKHPLNMKLDKNVLINNYSSKTMISLRAACSLNMNSGWQISPTNNKRRGILYRDPIKIVGAAGVNYIYETYVQYRGRGQIKSIFGWNDYSTDHTINLTSSVGNAYLDETFTVSSSFPYSGSGSINNSQDIYILYYLNYFVTPVSISTFQYLPDTNMNANYTNQGGVNITMTCN